MREIEKKQLELETRGKAIELKLRQLSVIPPRQETLKRSTPTPSGIRTKYISIFFI